MKRLNIRFKRNKNRPSGVNLVVFFCFYIFQNHLNAACRAPFLTALRPFPSLCRSQKHYPALATAYSSINLNTNTPSNPHTTYLSLPIYTRLAAHLSSHPYFPSQALADPKNTTKPQRQPIPIPTTKVLTTQHQAYLSSPLPISFHIKHSHFPYCAPKPLNNMPSLILQAKR